MGTCWKGSPEQGRRRAGGRTTSTHRETPAWRLSNSQRIREPMGDGESVSSHSPFNLDPPSAAESYLIVCCIRGVIVAFRARVRAWGKPWRPTAMDVGSDAIASTAMEVTNLHNLAFQLHDWLALRSDRAEEALATQDCIAFLSVS
jgi:hypothetical protein